MKNVCFKCKKTFKSDNKSYLCPKCYLTSAIKAQSTLPAQEPFTKKCKTCGSEIDDKSFLNLYVKSDTDGFISFCSVGCLYENIQIFIDNVEKENLDAF